MCDFAHSSLYHLLFDVSACWREEKNKMTEGIPVQAYAEVCLRMHSIYVAIWMCVFLSMTVCICACVLVLNLSDVSQTESQLCQEAATQQSSVDWISSPNFIKDKGLSGEMMAKTTMQPSNCLFHGWFGWSENAHVQSSNTDQRTFSYKLAHLVQDKSYT